MQSGSPWQATAASPALASTSPNCWRLELIPKGPRGAFLLVAAAPVFMPARDAEKVAWPYALLAGVVLAEIGTFNAYDPYIGGVGMPTRIPSWHELPIADFL